MALLRTLWLGVGTIRIHIYQLLVLQKRFDQFWVHLEACFRSDLSEYGGTMNQTGCALQPVSHNLWI